MEAHVVCAGETTEHSLLEPPQPQPATPEIAHKLIRMELFFTLKMWLMKMRAKSPTLLLYSDSCHARLVEKCLKRNLALPIVLGWGDSFMLDQLFFQTGGAYKLDDWGRPRTGEEITISPIHVFDESSIKWNEEVVVRGNITGVVKNRGMLTFDLETIDHNFY